MATNRCDRYIFTSDEFLDSTATRRLSRQRAAGQNSLVKAESVATVVMGKVE
ncbi:MAG TPA: hypothetical protein QF564_30575 [Pirellulaceae bacterium]|nr:hypothetical protein [Pirellulaceae bacterium]